MFSSLLWRLHPSSPRFTQFKVGKDEMLPLTLEHPPQHMTPTPPPTSPWRNKNQPGGSSQHWQWWSEEEAMSAEGEEKKPGFGASICRLHNDFILFENL